MNARTLAIALAVLTTIPVLPGAFATHDTAPEERGLSAGPQNILVHRAGWNVELVHDRLSFPTNLEFKGDELLVLEAGRYPYASQYDPEAGPCDRSAGQLMNCGELTALEIASDGTISTQRSVVDGLADPIGLEIAPNGDAYLTQYGEVSIVPDAVFDTPEATTLTHSTGYPAQTTDFVYAPITGTFVTGQGGESLEPNTTGPMGLAFDESDQVHVSQAIHGTPPDDPIVRDVTGLDYDNPYSSSVIVPDEGEISPEDVAARACRNCFDLTFASEDSEHADELFITENVGPYRLRASPGEGRTPLAGSTPADWNLLDGVNHVNLTTGQITRVVTFRADSGIAGITPTGIEYSPSDFPGGGDEMFVVHHSGFVPMTDDRGQVVTAHPDFTTGVGVRDEFVTGLDFPLDVTFGPDGSMYVIEFFDGELWRIAPPSQSAIASQPVR